MPAGWQIFRLVCVLQLIAGVLLGGTALIALLKFDSFYHFLALIVYGSLSWLAAFAITILHNNYPATPVSGRQKTIFNWLYLVNFFFLAFLFSYIIKEYRLVQAYRDLYHSANVKLNISAYYLLVIHTLVALLQLLLLYGLFVLRRLLYANFNDKSFEFER